MMSCYVRPLQTMLCVLCILQFVFYMAGGCNVEERIALMQIKSSSLDANSLDSWGLSDDCCSWDRVTCNNNKRVSDLSLGNFYLRGPNPENTAECAALSWPGGYWNLNLTIFSSFQELQVLDFFGNVACIQNFEGHSSALQGLTELRYLNLGDNTLVGNNILESLGKLAYLEVINIEMSSLSGVLQNIDFRTFNNLRELRLGTNNLNGSIPASLFELPRLEYLDISDNNLQGHIPIPSRLNFSSLLRELNLGSNQLNGSITASIFELPRLEHLDISGNLLQGHIPMASSSNLPSSLQTLELSSNKLNGTFDFFWLRNCTMLKNVDLSGNPGLAIDVKFDGRVPPFQLKSLMLSGCILDKSIITGPNFLGTQRHLEILDLSNNNLTGSFPNWILANEATLLYLNLANNSLVGQLHSMWQYPFNLQMFNISKNNFAGRIPTNIGSVFPNLTVLDTSYNSISGDLPPSLCNISSLEYMDLSKNKFTGEVPTCLFTDCSNLMVLNLSNNNLGGPILGGASNLSSIISSVYLACNNFTGALPNSLSGKNVATIDLHDNKLTGKLDTSFWNLPSLQVLNVATNSMTGQIYPTICKSTYLRFLDMSDNYFSGSLPNCTMKLRLSYLNMSSNTLTSIHCYFFDCSYVGALDLRYNQFNGSLDWIQHLSRTQLLLLGDNLFEGQISPYLCHLQHLHILDLSRNRLSGSLPSCIGGISFNDGAYDYDFWSSMTNSFLFAMDINVPDSIYNAKYGIKGFTFSTKGNIYIYGSNFFNTMFGIDLSMNMLSGEIPWEIGNLSHIKSLNLSHNFFMGQIPATLANMSATESLDLSYNELSGLIPWQLAQMSSLEVFSVAYNNLSGCIPNSGQFSSFSEESYLGNVNLNNLSQGNPCSPVLGSIKEGDVHEASADIILYVITAASFVLAFWATVVAFHF